MTKPYVVGFFLITIFAFFKAFNDWEQSALLFFVGHTTWFAIYVGTLLGGCRP